MVTLANIANAIGHPQQIDRLKLHFYGIAGEITRPYYMKDRRFFYLFEHSADDFTTKLFDTLVKPRADLLHADVVHTAANYLRDFTGEATGMGFSVKDLSTVFYLRDRLRRWGGSNANRSLPVRAARKLHRIVTGRPYKPVFTNTKAEERSDLLNPGLEHFRSLCFDQIESPLWALIDRSQLENLLSSKTPAQQRRRQHGMLYDIFTLFQYSSADFSRPTNKPV